ncbi:hypothetical protein [Pseudolactococcus reticulitermitis]|uniref:Uncharacterized protein n=1 Tax=Pseudolactococcus reticulitermitis TaxID=2025039 RepID=A0A224X9B9_9LACT|nr:hypothetical protein [Lactococcus reticulitermitis]GAX46784.1 hypothetical protein RsY01_364 [Lactococcus reticulitermitis]
MKKLFEALSAIIIGACIVYWGYKADCRLDAIQAKQEQLEKRVDNLTAAMQTKDKEIETGLRQVQDGIMLKIDWLEKQVVE